jgi:hypothetical protein
LREDELTFEDDKEEVTFRFAKEDQQPELQEISASGDEGLSPATAPGSSNETTVSKLCPEQVTKDNQPQNLFETIGDTNGEPGLETDTVSSNEPSLINLVEPELSEHVVERNSADAESREDKSTTAQNAGEIDDVGSELPQVTQAEEEMAAITRDTNEEAEIFVSNLDDTTILDEGNSNNVMEEAPPEATAEIVEVEEEMAGVTGGAETTEQFLAEAQIAGSSNGEFDKDDEHDRMFQNIKAMLDASTDEANADTKNAVVTIDPYYTIDYFASQGIKLELDQNPKDQLGQNLKKFTHWLRHMKKLGPEDATEVISRTDSDAEIQQIADSSNTVREVVTEAMALVLEKQGKKEKAIELYNKLSFLNRHKSAYFADKIKNLKGT